MKVKGKAKQIKLVLYLNNKYILPIYIDKSFLYIGRYFDFNMSITKNIRKYYQKHYQRYVIAKISWHLTVADIPLNLGQAKFGQPVLETSSTLS